MGRKGSLGPVRALLAAPACGSARIAWPSMLTPDEGADTIVGLASLGETDGWSGPYFAWRHVETPKAGAEDPDLARRLREVSERLTGLGATANLHPSPRLPLAAGNR